MADSVGDGQDRARDFKVVLQTGADVDRGVEDENIMRLSGRDGVVSEVVDDGSGSLDGKRDLEFSEERNERAGDGAGGGHGQKNVASSIDEVDKNVGRQIGTKA